MKRNIFKLISACLFAILCVTGMYAGSISIANANHAHSSDPSMYSPKGLVNTFTLHSATVYSSNESPYEITVKNKVNQDKLFNGLAVVILSKFLESFDTHDVNYELAAFGSGSNALSNADISIADVVFKSDDEEIFLESVKLVNQYFTDNGINYLISATKIHRPVVVLDNHSKKAVVNLPLLLLSKANNYTVKIYDTVQNYVENTIHIRSFVADTNSVRAITEVTTKTVDEADKVEEKAKMVGALLGFGVDINVVPDDSLSTQVETFLVNKYASKSFNDQTPYM